MPANKSSKKKLQFYLDAHHRLFIALGVGIVAAAISYRNLSGPQTTLIAWICFAFSIIIPEWIIILTAHPREIRSIARLQDSSRSFIFLFVIGAALVSLFAIGYLLITSKHSSQAEVTRSIILTMGSVITSWWLVHTVFTMRYAHEYYDTDTDEGDIKKVGGLKFPEEDNPDYLDFVYFSFVLGMTFQVSDVDITSRTIRRLAWMHGLISFAFSTAIVALSINVISGLVSH
ncbi:DUF1345 domain-containing protein [Mucilaginibacter robiniae]|uniref:DUF1345 domain-containing protein n=1 Tax=Mucilaginibacter robiniae TaxID=2728022 RepID=A0A7L5DZ00_9SPHI|nr:DUF1345 domain-containing protein [Mucilaginibacter robiniae]QJD94504.1 DUF1345 domain-containing protein [Mucilaginibacter robiniae]